MSEFKSLADNVHQTYNYMATDELYTVDLDGDELYDAYLMAFPKGTNELFRERHEYDCQSCKNFIRNLGRVVAIRTDGAVLTVWDNHQALAFPYDQVAAKLQTLVLSSKIKGIYRSKEHSYGCPSNLDTHTFQTWYHFNGKVTRRHHSLTPEAEIGAVDSRAHVFRRGLEELRDADVAEVIALIEANNLYRGQEHLALLKGFQKLQNEYFSNSKRDWFIWKNLAQTGAAIRNSVIGSLLIDLAEGRDLEYAVKAFETKVAPANYKRPTALITPRMIEDAMKTLAELGLETAVNRRFATISDVSVNDVLFVDRAVQSYMKDALSELLLKEVKPTVPKLNPKQATAISAEEFLNSVVPKATAINLLLENKHLGNFVSLTAPVDPTAGNLFKWPSNFAWSYDGEVTDSIKAKVKAAGGKVDARFRVSLAWSNHDDLDLHVKTATGSHIYFATKYCYGTGGQLDVDMNAGGRMSRSPVENVFWNKIVDGEYRVMVNNYNRRESIDTGFTLEVEFDGAITQYSYARSVGEGETVKALTIVVKNGKLESIKVDNDKIVGGDLAIEKWGLTTGQLVPVETLMLSPNYWNGQAVGNKHWIFVLKGAKNPEPVRGIYNEFLRPDLEKHRKVFEILGAKTKAQPTDNQLSGLGFSSTRKDEVMAVVDGRSYQIQF